MGKNKSSSKAARASNRGDEVRVRSKFTQLSAINTSTGVSALGNIGTASGTGILANDVSIQSLTDMFRLYRINSITFEFQPASGAGTAAVQIPAGFLGFVPFGAATTPTSITDFETPLVSEPTVSFGAASATAPLTKECGTRLTLKNSDMPVLQGPGGGWLATQDDGTQGYWGKLFWALAGTTASNAINYLLTTHFDISFKDLLDPALISRNIAMRHPNGFPQHWEMDEDHPLKATQRTLSALCLPQSDGPDCPLNRRQAIVPPDQGTGGVRASPWWR